MKTTMATWSCWHACKLGTEGVVSKRLGSRDRSERSPNWLEEAKAQFQKSWDAWAWAKLEEVD